MAESPQPAQVPTAADVVKAEDQAEQMCCVGDGTTTADQHRHESEDGKCCTDEE